MAFLSIFIKRKFQAQDSQEIKEAAWDFGSRKLRSPDGTLLRFEEILAKEQSAFIAGTSNSDGPGPVILSDITFNHLGLPICFQYEGSYASWKTLVDRFHMRLSLLKAIFCRFGSSDSYQVCACLKAFNLLFFKHGVGGLLSFPNNSHWFRSSKLIMVKKEVSIQMVVASRAFGLNIVGETI
ncbi:hypothetical protein Tco_0486377 [Tanacetum coccineum]